MVCLRADPPRYVQLDVPVKQRQVRVDLCLFDSNEHHLRVLDNRAPSGLPRAERLTYAMKSGHYLPAVNGGFFEADAAFAPVGLMISYGQRTGEFSRKYWLRGVVQVRDGKLELLDYDDFQDDPAITDLIQSGPWLIVDGERWREGIGEGYTASRTFIAHDGKGQWVFGVTQAVSLGELVDILESALVRDYIEIEHALNLDGGPSTAFWMRTPNRETISREEAWPVRNYLALSRQPYSPPSAAAVRAPLSEPTISPTVDSPALTPPSDAHN